MGDLELIVPIYRRVFEVGAAEDTSDVATGTCSSRGFHEVSVRTASDACSLRPSRRGSEIFEFRFCLLGIKENQSPCHDKGTGSSCVEEEIDTYCQIEA